MEPPVPPAACPSAKLEGNPSLSCCQGHVCSHTVTRFGCKTNYKWSRCHAVTLKRWVFACWSSTFLSLTANGLTTGFRKLYFKELENKQLLELKQPSVGVLLFRGDTFFCLEAEQCLLIGCKLLQGNKCFSSQMIFTDGLAHGVVSLLHRPHKVLSA